MSISGINGSSNWWQWQSQSTQSASTGATAAGSSAAGGGIANPGTTAAAANLPAFMQAFSADLQTMLTQLGSTTASAATATAGGSAAPDGASGQAAASQAAGGTHHHHHHHHAGAGAGGAMQSAANQLVGTAGSSLPSGSLSATQINQSASVLAADVMQALQSYGAPAQTASGPSILA